MRVPLPSVSQQPDQSTQFSAPAVTPQQDYTGQQLRGLGGAMQQVGDDTARLAAGLQDQYDEARTKEADMALAYAIDTDVGGYLQSVGKEATGDARKKALDAVAQKRRTIEASLGNQMQRQMFQKAADERMFRASSVSQKHEAQQTRVFSGSQSLARAQLLGQDAFNALMTGDHKAFKDAKGLMLSEVDAAATIAGASDEEKQLLRQGATTRLHGQIIEKLSNDGKGTAASDYLQGAKDEIAPDALLKLEGMVKDAGVDEQATNLARDVAARSGSLMETIDSIDRMHADKTITAEVRQRAIAQAEHASDRRREETDRQRREVLSGAIEWVGSGHALTPAQRADLQTTGQQWKLDAVIESGGQYTTSSYGFHELNTLPDEDLLRDFKTADDVWQFYRTEMSNEHLPRMVARWHNAMVASGKADTRSQQQQQTDLVNASFEKEAAYYFMRLPESDPNWTEIPKDKQASLSAWERAFRLEVDSIGRQTGAKEATTEVYREAFDRLTDKRNRANITVDGKPRTFAALTPGDVNKGRVQLSPEVAKKVGSSAFDLRLATPELVKLARETLVSEVPGFAPTEQDVYSRAAELIASANKTQLDNVRSEQERGLNLMAERVAAAVDSSDTVRRAWQRANSQIMGGYPTKEGRRSEWDFSLIEPSASEMERAMHEIMWEDFGIKIANEFGLDTGEMWDRIATTYRATKIQRMHQEHPTYLDLNAPVIPTSKP